MIPELPDELWRQIFLLSVDTDVLSDWLPTSMAECAWFKDVFGEWKLRPPQEAINMVQRKSNFTKKSIVLTCKRFGTLGAEFLFHSLFITSPSKMNTLCDNIKDKSSLGWWTERLHITHFYDLHNITLGAIQPPFLNLLSQLPNLEIVIIDQSLGSATGPVVDALVSTARKTLKTLSIRVPSEAMAKVIWALSGLKKLVAAHIQFDPPTPGSTAAVDECINLGAASDIHFPLANLQQLSLNGHIDEFLEQAIGWSFPSLVSLSLHSEVERLGESFAAFIKKNGKALLFLDAFCPQTPALDVADILDLCPLLRTLGFNADWRPNNPESPPSLPRLSALANNPHANITTIGLHGLQYALGSPARELSTNPLDNIDALDISLVNAHLTQRANETNFEALTKRSFPRLERIRILNRSVLHHLNDSGLNVFLGEFEERMRMGHDEETLNVLERYENWCSRSFEIGARLEDCTGGLLGLLPEDEEDYSDDEDSSEESEEYDEGEYDSYEEDSSFDSISGGPHTTELRQLIEECRAMESGRVVVDYSPAERARIERGMQALGIGLPSIEVTPPGYRTTSGRWIPTVVPSL